MVLLRVYLFVLFEVLWTLEGLVADLGGGDERVSRGERDGRAPRIHVV